MESIRRPSTSPTDGVVTLRPFVRDDAQAVADACQDPEIPRWTVVPMPYRLDDALEAVAA